MWPTKYFVVLLIPAVFAKFNFDPEEYLANGKDDGLLSDLYARDIEPLPQGPIAWGHKYMGGGAGEGKQFLSPEGVYENKEEVKTDAILPAYCEPPNPCPPGQTGVDGCLEDFENTAEFSRDYQGRQNCLCDEEHMFSCPPGHNKATDGVTDQEMAFSQALDQLLEKANIDPHKTLVAKKFHEKRGAPRRKRSINRHSQSKRQFFYHTGEKLPVVKKDGRNLHF